MVSSDSLNYYMEFSAIVVTRCSTDTDENSCTRFDLSRKYFTGTGIITPTLWEPENWTDQTFKISLGFKTQNIVMDSKAVL